MSKTGIRAYATKTKGLRWLAYYHRDGKQMLKRGFRTSRQAERWRSEALTRATSPADSTVTVGEWVSRWLEQHRGGVKPSTYQRYESSLRIWILPHIGPTRLTKLTHHHIEAMHEAAISGGRSPLTVRRNHTPMRLALQEAVRDGLIAQNPAALVRLPRMKPFEINPFTPEEVHQFLKGNEENPLFPVLHLALNSGLRLGEIVALRVGRDIDLDNKTITVRETQRQSITDTPKSRNSIRRVTLPLEACEVLSDAIAMKPQGALAFHWKPDVLSRSMHRACQVARVKRIRFHDLRHTHATLLLASGANPKAVSSRLGHSSVAFTLQVYGHVIPGMDESLADLSGELFTALYQKSITDKNGTGSFRRVSAGN